MNKSEPICSTPCMLRVGSGICQVMFLVNGRRDHKDKGKVSYTINYMYLKQNDYPGCCEKILTENDRQNSTFSRFCIILPIVGYSAMRSLLNCGWCNMSVKWHDRRNEISYLFSGCSRLFASGRNRYISHTTWCSISVAQCTNHHSSLHSSFYVS